MTTGNSTRRGSPVAVKNTDGRRKPTHQQVEVRHNQIWELIETIRDAGPEPGTACGRLAYLAEDLFSASALDQSGLVHVYDVQAMLVGGQKCGDASTGQLALIEKVLPMIDEYVQILDGMKFTGEGDADALPTTEPSAPIDSTADLELSASCDRVKLSLQATYQVEVMIDSLLREARNGSAESLPHLLQGVGMRIHELNSIIMSALGDSFETESELRYRLQGRREEVEND